MTGWTLLNVLFQWRSLKTRVTIFTLTIFLVGIWSLAFYASKILRDDIERLLGEQQLATVSIVAAEIGRELDVRFKALETVAANLGPAMRTHPAAVQGLLERLPIFHAMFNAGIIALDVDGTAIADIPRARGRTGANYKDMDSIAAALRQGKSTIGRPVLGRKLRTPVFCMTVPIRDARKRVIGALSGVTALGDPSFLDVLTENHDAKSGAYLLLLAAQPRLTVASSDNSRIMQALPAPGINPAMDRFLQGHEGSAIITDAAGVDALSSVKGVPATDWLVAAALPTAQAFAPIRLMQRRVFLATLLLTLIAGALTWWMLRRQLSPMVAAAKAMTPRSDSRRPPQPLPVTSQDEIGDLVGGFNRLLESLAERESTLRESEQRYRVFFEFSPDAIFVYRDDLIVFANAATARLFEAESAAALIGRNWHELIAADEWAITEMRIAALVSGEAASLPPLERCHATRDGQVLVLESTGARIIFDGQPAMLTVMRDITARKQTEEQRLSYARQQRDTLVREVHHRIKNNLQSVAGLLQRELGKFRELDPRLETAISQVDAIAVVHGLQSADPNEAIRLCDSVRNICKTVSDLAQHPVRFQIEHEYSSFRPVWIESGEAVSVALVLNELILNAVKHSPPDQRDPSVSLSADGARAQLVIRNALKGEPGFNIDTGAGLGTGLRLVRSLLPNEGARLTYERNAENFMLTHLELTSPVVVVTTPPAVARES